MGSNLNSALRKDRCEVGTRASKLSADGVLAEICSLRSPQSEGFTAVLGRNVQLHEPTLNMYELHEASPHSTTYQHIEIRRALKVLVID